MDKRPMRIVLVVTSFPTLSETFIANKFIGLLDRGLDVYVMSRRSDSPEWTRFPQLQSRQGLRSKVRVAWPQRPRWLKALLSPFVLLRCLLKNTRDTCRYLQQGWHHYGARVLGKLYSDAELICLKPDLIHFEFGPLALGRTWVKEPLNCRIVVSYRGSDLNFVGLDDPDYYQEVWNSADALHFLGKDLWCRAQNRGCPANKIHVLIPPAIDLDFFNPGRRTHSEIAGAFERPLRVLSVGRLESMKGYEYALATIKLLVDQGLEVEYRIVGDGSAAQALTLIQRQYRLDGIAHFLGAQPRGEVKSQLNWADVFLHPAIAEGFCNAVIEAQAMAVPVVCSDAGGLRENVADGETGFVVPSRNPSALAEKLVTLAQNPGLRGQMGRAGRQRASTTFGLPTQIAAFVRLYDRVGSKQSTGIGASAEDLGSGRRQTSRQGDKLGEAECNLR